MTEDFLKELNEQQIRACTTFDRPLLVLAGPGSGKTKVLTMRIACIINSSNDEQFKILALTFTNKASREMRLKVEEMVGKEIKRTFIGTFHSFCHDLLKAYGQLINIDPEFVIYDKHEDLITLLIDAVRERVADERAGNIDSTILLERYENISIIENTVPSFYYSYLNLKSKLIGPDNVDDTGKYYSEDFKLIFEIYQKALRKANVLDFSDLIYYSYKLLFEKKFIADQMRKIYKYILIDEGQDTNKAQFEMLKVLCGESFNNLFIVADEDQLIYEWNDAKFEYLVELHKKYNMETIQLFESFRCPKDLIEIANRLISHNSIRLQDKEVIRAAKENEAGSFVVNRFTSQDEEADFIAAEVNKLMPKSYMPSVNTICVISRTKYILDKIIQKFNEQEIPYHIPMIQEKFSSREMNFFLDLLKLIVNENEKVAALKVCKYLEINFEEVIQETANRSLYDVIYGYMVHLNSKLAAAINQIRANQDNFGSYLNDSLQLLLSSDNFEDKELEDIQNDIAFLKENYESYKREKSGTLENLKDFMNHIALASRKAGKGVALLTGHASKGLEFDYVFLVSLNQGVFPDYRAIKTGGRELEEERRNCFVSITRTKKKLFISYVNYRETRYGNRAVEPSQFLSEMGVV